MSRTLLLICFLAIIFVAVAVSAYTQLSHLIHIEINPSENETKVWEENTSKAPVPASPLYPQPGKTILKKLFGKEDPKNLTLLDGIMKVFEMPEGKAKIQELIGSWNVVAFQGISFSFSEPEQKYSVHLIAFPLLKPEDKTIFSFVHEGNDSFSFRITKNKFKWNYRNLTKDELSELLEVTDLSKYKNTYFIAAENEEMNTLLLEGFAWDDGDIINLNGFKAYKGVQVLIAYEKIRGYENLQELLRQVDEIIIIKSESSDYRFEIVEGRKISANNGVYVFGFIENCTERGAPYIKMINGWNLTLDGDLWISNVLKCFDGRIYAAGVEIAKIEDGKIAWIKNLAIKRVGYEGTRENPIPVEYEDYLNVFDVESDGEFLYFNTRGGVVKTDENLNVIWAVVLKSESNIRFGDWNDDISVSDGIYLTKGDKIIKLSKDGKPEWAVSLKSKEKIKRKVEIPEEKRKLAEKEGIKIPEFEEVPKYSIELYAVYAGDNVYVAGFADEYFHELPLWKSEVHPFLAKLSRDGEIFWAEIIDVTYPADHYVAEGKIIKDGKRFIAWVSNYVLFVFDENGDLIDFYLLKGYISDLDLRDDTIYVASPVVCREWLENGEERFERINVEIEKRDTSATPIDILTEKLEPKVKNFECYSKDWEKKTLIPFG